MPHIGGDIDYQLSASVDADNGHFKILNVTLACKLLMRILELLKKITCSTCVKKCFLMHDNLLTRVWWLVKWDILVLIWLMWCRNYWNRSTFANVVVKSLLILFCGPRCICQSFNHYLGRSDYDNLLIWGSSLQHFRWLFTAYMCRWWREQHMARNTEVLVRLR